MCPLLSSLWFFFFGENSSWPVLEVKGLIGIDYDFIFVLVFSNLRSGWHNKFTQQKKQILAGFKTCAMKRKHTCCWCIWRSPLHSPPPLRQNASDNSSVPWCCASATLRLCIGQGIWFQMLPLRSRSQKYTLQAAGSYSLSGKQRKNKNKTKVSEAVWMGSRGTCRNFRPVHATPVRTDSICSYSTYSI